MGSLRSLALAGAAALASVPALGADLPPLIQKAPVPVEEFAGGWYLRGDIGISSQYVRSLYNILYETAGSVTNLSKGFDSAGIFGLGLGYQFNSWLRFDFTGEYRAGSTFRGLDTYTPEPNSGTGVGVDDYSATKSEWLFLFNAYLDLGTWWHVTPFVGAGVGFSRVTISNFRDVNVATAGLAYADDASKWNFAWALHAGLAYHVTPAFTVELAYRYVRLGDGRSGDLITYHGVSLVDNPMHFRNIDSHDVKLGIRWLFYEPTYLPPPLIRKG
jgi:opacity protein-like surface antigen